MQPLGFSGRWAPAGRFLSCRRGPLPWRVGDRARQRRGAATSLGGRRWSPRYGGVLSAAPPEGWSSAPDPGGDLVGPLGLPPSLGPVCVGSTWFVGHELSCPRFWVGLWVAFEPLRRAVRTRREPLLGTVLPNPTCSKHVLELVESSGTGGWRPGVQARTPLGCGGSLPFPPPSSALLSGGVWVRPEDRLGMWGHELSCP